ncbi:tRNA guanosine-2'-O-methyltransferase TRM11 [Elsinoe ampelina]|uniref:tRNA (guanine(10)-N(2))-methyltransferase n=1 Tax=Elsinoe ampelina TaxID=302913 RepID=A0A6A6G5X7_9PEZI|nr:tRNA guanosine-2'-O-methyltransferase TRM11 [Elsinoe ampelina]
MSPELDEGLYLVRFVQLHESFRLPELKALAEFHGIDLEVVDYRTRSPFTIVRLPSPEAARLLISRSILALSISSLWGTASTYDDLHTHLKTRTSHLWPTYHTCPFRFTIDSFQGKRPQSTRTELINSFGYMDMQGPIRPSDPSVTTFVISEEYPILHAPKSPVPSPSPSPLPSPPTPSRVFLSLSPSPSSRHLTTTLDLKHRHYISTTSMDAELSLISANLALSAPGKTIYDPFCGTGSFLVAAAAFGAMVAGSDMDGRVVRGRVKEAKNEKEKERSVRGNLRQYGLEERWLDGFVGDLTNSPVRNAGGIGQGEGASGGKWRWLDGIICDPPYGVREGLKVLGSHKPELQQEVKMKDGRVAHLAPGYIPPKRPYSFPALLSDILTFASNTLVDNGRLCIWIPVATTSDEANPTTTEDLGIPTHPCLKVWSLSTQEFSRWSRRLVVYVRKSDNEVDEAELKQYNSMRGKESEKGTADELNEFRRRAS